MIFFQELLQRQKDRLLAVSTVAFFGSGKFSFVISIYTSLVYFLSLNRDNILKHHVWNQGIYRSYELLMGCIQHFLHNLRVFPMDQPSLPSVHYCSLSWPSQPQKQCNIRSCLCFVCWSHLNGFISCDYQHKTRRRPGCGWHEDQSLLGRNPLSRPIYHRFHPWLLKHTLPCYQDRKTSQSATKFKFWIRSFALRGGGNLGMQGHIGSRFRSQIGCSIYHKIIYSCQNHGLKQQTSEQEALEQVKGKTAARSRPRNGSNFLDHCWSSGTQYLVSTRANFITWR